MLVILFPVCLFISVLIAADSKGGVFFCQERVTQYGKKFWIIKFRTMAVTTEKIGSQVTVKNDSRVTKVGKVLRKYRLDELPQLINIILGDMSFVGPRPERIEHVEKYMEEMPEFSYRFRVNGGLTGYAQVWGKYNTSAYDKLRYDLMYIENQSFYLDFKILVLTLRTVFKSESAEGFLEADSREMKQEIQESKNVLLQKLRQ